MIQPDDVADLRRGIDYIGVCVCFIVHDGEGQILLQKRGPKARDEQGRWDIGGGAIEFGESTDQAIRREIAEEYCCEPLKVDFLVAYDAHRQHNGAKTHWVALVHAIKVDPAKIKIGEPDKITEVGWFTSQNLPTPLHSQFQKSYQVAIDKKIVS